ncbi:MAG: hypothetical protein IJK84_09500 [Bacteroidales bacterium]|nr:hypothetical protein [Bacteroidales bacterium]
MAILTGINTRHSGSAGEWTFARLGGKTVAKQKVAKSPSSSAPTPPSEPPAIGVI